MKTLNFIALLSILVVLSSCASLSISKNDCLSADWENIGFEDGNNGISASTNTSFKQSCTEYGVESDIDAYNRGHTKGMNLFCQAENGFNYGEQGYRYSVICPQEFEDEYAVGYKFYIAHSNVNALEKQLNTNAATITKLEIGINRALFRLNNDDLSTFEENRLRQEIESMESQIKSYELSTQRIEPVLIESQLQLQNLKAHYNR